MKKLIAEAPDRVVVAEVDSPRCLEDEVLVRGVRSLLSPGSEMKRVRSSSAHQRNAWPNHDLGYALAGTIVEVGQAVQGLKAGDRVVTMGNHQELVAAKAAMASRFPAIPLPDDVDWDIAPFVIWGRSCINWMRRANIQLHENVAVVGCGLVGLLMTMWSRLVHPRTLICTDLHEPRLALAKKCGADVVLNARAVDAVKAVQDLTGCGADVTLHCASGGAVRAFEDAQRMTRSGGRVILIGHHTENCVALPYQFTDKDLLGANVRYDYDTRLFLDGLKLLRAGKLPVRDIVTHKLPYTQAPDIYAKLIHAPEDTGAVLLEWK